MLNMSRYAGDGVNLTALHLYDRESAIFYRIMAEWRARFRSSETNPMERGLTVRRGKGPTTKNANTSLSVLKILTPDQYRGAILEIGTGIVLAMKIVSVPTKIC